MTKKIIAVILITVMAAALFSACTNKENAETDGIVAADYIPEAEWYSLNENNYVEQAAGVTTAVIKEWYEDYTILASYPVMADKEEASDKMFSFVMDEIAMFEAEMAAAPGEKYDVKPEFLLTYKPYIYAESLISFKFVTYTDSGVSKTVNYIDTFVFDRATGNEIALSDLFKEDADYLSVIAERSKEELLKNNMLNDHYDEAQFTSGTAATLGNYEDFTVCDSGIIFFFNQGQVASPMAGSFEVLIGFDALKDILKTNILEGKSLFEQETAAPAETGDLPSYLKSGENEMSAFSINGIDPINDKVVAITFDDGPHPSLTMQVVNIFKKYDSKATFFMLGKNAQEYPDVAKQVYEAGMEIGNHSYDHPDFFTMSYDEMVNNLEKSSDYIEEATGKRPLVFRAPYGNVTAEAAQQYGKQSIYWTIDTLDWDHKDPAQNYSHTMSHVYDGAVVLMHDIHETTVASVEDIVSSLVDEGYKLVTVTQLDQILLARGQDPTWRLGRDASTARQTEEE